jgi:hypothetical protein
MQWLHEFLEKLFSHTQIKKYIDDTFLLKYNYLPTSLFKYRLFSIDSNSLKNLSENTIWLTEPRSFNEPFPCMFGLEYIEIKDKRLEEELNLFFDGYPNALDLLIAIEKLQDRDNSFFKIISIFKQNKLYDKKMILENKTFYDHRNMEHIGKLSPTTYQQFKLNYQKLNEFGYIDVR